MRRQEQQRRDVEQRRLVYERQRRAAGSVHVVLDERRIAGRARHRV